jgi:hypothetical protein
MHISSVLAFWTGNSSSSVSSWTYEQERAARTEVGIGPGWEVTTLDPFQNRVELIVKLRYLSLVQYYSIQFTSTQIMRIQLCRLTAALLCRQGVEERV